MIIFHHVRLSKYGVPPTPAASDNFRLGITCFFWPYRTHFKATDLLGSLSHYIFLGLGEHVPQI